jgi:rifampin ADP-ribosylating transferase
MTAAWTPVSHENYRQVPGNPSQSYRSQEPLRVVELVQEWEGHPAAVLQGMLDALANLRRRGMALIEE